MNQDYIIDRLWAKTELCDTCPGCCQCYMCTTDDPRFCDCVQLTSAKVILDKLDHLQEAFSSCYPNYDPNTLCYCDWGRTGHPSIECFTVNLIDKLHYLRMGH